MKEKAMSRSHDLVAIAKRASDGEVGGISVFDLSGNDRIKIFFHFAQKLHHHYSHLNGDRLFVPWKTENFRDTGGDLSRDSVLHNGLFVDDSLYPKEESYTPLTRVVVLASDYFRLPKFGKPKDGAWNLGDKKLVTRICMTQDGQFWLEWYEGTVTEMYERHPNLPKKVLVGKTKFIPLNYTMYYVDNEPVPAELWKLVTKCPEIVSSFAYRCIGLLEEEATERKERAERDAALARKLKIFGQVFGIR